MSAARSEPRQNVPVDPYRRGVVVASLVVVTFGGISWAAARVMGGGVLGQDPFGRQAPAFQLPLVSGGGSIAFAELLGKPIVLNFWASWCTPCQGEAPVLAAGQRQWRDRGVVFLGVDVSDRTSDAIAFLARYRVPYASAADARGALTATYGVLGFPETFFIDRDGMIVAKYVGPIDRLTLDANIASIA